MILPFTQIMNNDCQYIKKYNPLKTFEIHQ